MTFWYMESQKPTREERSWVIGMAEAGFNIDNVALHFDILINNCLPNNQSFRENKVGWRPPEIGQTEKKTNSTGGKFHSDHIKTGDFLTENSLSITSRNCLWYVSVHRNCPEPSPKHMENVQNIEIPSFWKTFYDRHCAPYKWNFAVFGIG